MAALIASLYPTGSEVGPVWDFGDLTYEKQVWRRNLLLWSDTLSNSVWTRTDVTPTDGAATAPGGASATLLTEGSAGTATCNQATTTIANETYCLRRVFKRGNHDWVLMGVGDNLFTNGVRQWVNLATGALGTRNTFGAATGVDATITNLGDGWYGVVLIVSGINSTTLRPYTHSASANASTTRVANGTRYEASSQFERGNSATAYQRITDFNSDFMAAFPAHTLFQDSAGTTPVWQVEQPVGLCLDRRFVTNPQPTLSHTGIGGSVTDNGDGTFTVPSGVTARFQFDLAQLVNGQSYETIITNLTTTGASCTVDFCDQANTAYANGYNGPHRSIASRATYDSSIRFVDVTAGVGATVVTRAPTIRRLPGVHLIQGTSGARPTMRARANMLSATRDFTQSPWANVSGSVTVTPGLPGIGGALVMNRIVPAAGSGFYGRRQDISVVGGVQYVMSFDVMASSGGYYIEFFTGGVGAIFDPAAGTVIVQTGVTATIGAADTSGVRRCTVTFTPGGSSLAVMDFRPTTSTTINQAMTGDGTSGILVGRPDLRMTGAYSAGKFPAYQEVLTSTSYDTFGFPVVAAFNGTSSCMQSHTTLDLSASDKAFVAAGVRKLSDSAGAIICELGASTVSNNGAFYLSAPDTAAANYGTRTRGTVSLTGYTHSTFASPTSNVVAVSFDNGGAGGTPANCVSARFNGVANTTSPTGSTSAGNFANATFNVGARNATSVYFNGEVSCLAVRGGALPDAATIVGVESSINAFRQLAY